MADESTVTGQAISNGNLDDPLLWDGCAAWNGGLNQRLGPHQIGSAQFADGLDIDIDNSGSVVARRGTRTIGTEAVVAGKRAQGAIQYSPTGGTEKLVIAIDGSLQAWDGYAWGAFGTSAMGTDDLVAVDIVQGVDKLFVIDGGNTDILQTDGTSEVSLSTNAPDKPHFIAWHTNRLVAAHAQSVPDAVYFSSILASDFDGTSAWDKTNDVIRVGAGDGEPITGILPWSDYNLLVFKARQTWAITCTPTETTLANWSVSLLSDRVGCVAHRTAVRVGSDVWFLARDGVHSVSYALANQTKGVVLARSDSIRPIIDRINWAYVHRATATYWNNRYILSLPLDSNTDCSHILVYNTLSDSWVGLWTGWDATAFAVQTTEEQERLAFGTSAGEVRAWRDYIADDAEQEEDFRDGFSCVTLPVDLPVSMGSGDAIAASVTTRALTFAQPVNDKSPFELQIETIKSGSTITVDARRDGGEFELVDSWTVPNPALNLPLDLSSTNEFSAPGYQWRHVNISGLAPFRQIQFRVSSSNWKLGLRTLLCGAFLDTVRLRPQT